MSEYGDDSAEFFGDDDQDNGPELLAERGAFERTSRDSVLTNILEGLDLNHLSKNKNIVSKRDAFFIKIQEVCMNDMNKNQTEVDYILTLASKVTKPEYKNSIAFILGFSIISKGKIDENKFKQVCEQELKQYESIEPPDLIRYARLILTL